MKQMRWMWVVIIWTGLCHAQPHQRVVTVGLTAGLDLPVFNTVFRDYWKNASSYSIETQLFVNQQFALCPRIGYHGFALDHGRLEEEFGRDVSGTGGQLLFKKGKRSLWETGLQLQLFISHPTDIVAFYLTLGGSYYQIIYQEAEGQFVRNDNEYTEMIRDKESFHGYGPQAGMGLEFWLHHRLCIVSEAQLHFAVTSLSFGSADGGQVEEIFFRDSNKTAFISILWGCRFQF